MTGSMRFQLVDCITEFMTKGHFQLFQKCALCSMPFYGSHSNVTVKFPTFKHYPLDWNKAGFAKSCSDARVHRLSFNSPPFQHFISSQLRCFSDTSSEYTVKVPNMGDSITEGSINHWKKVVGDFVETDEVVAVIDTDKVSVDISSPVAGQLTALNAEEGDVVEVGKPLFLLNTTAASFNAVKTQTIAPKPSLNTAKYPVSEGVDDSAGEISSLSAVSKKGEDFSNSIKNISNVSAANYKDARGEKRTPMSRMRLRIAERLKGAQNTAAMLTTFNECDMGSLMALRSEMNEAFQEVHEIKMGFVSAFLCASALSLKKFPVVNAYIEDKEIVYKDYVDISVAVATPNGLMVPVIRDCDKKSWADLEKNLNDLAKRARKNQIALEEMAGGTFTISNGGVYGSMMGTPLLNPPQASILGMHAISKRAVVRGDQIVIRPMMYLALTYDHRLIDGRDAVTFLNSIKNYIEDPRRMLLNL